MKSVASDVARYGTGVVVAALVTTGVATGAVLFESQREALDRSLLAAAQAQMHPDDEDEWTIEHTRQPVQAWWMSSTDERVPVVLVASASRTEQPSYGTYAGQRWLVLPVEREEGDHEVHALIAARAGAVTAVNAVGPFALAFGAFAVLAAAVSGIVLRATVQHAFAPIDRARWDAEQVLAHGQHIAEDGPIEVRSLLIAVNGLLGRLAIASDAQKRFTAEAAHELRTPVTSMLGELDVALRHPRDSDEYRRILGSVREEVARLRRIVDALATLARLDVGTTGPPERQRAGEIVARAVQAEGAALTGAGCALRVVAESDPEIDGDRAMLELAVGNLLRNAARHAPGRPVEIAVREQGSHAVIEVHDAGEGVPADRRETVFDRFAREGTSRRLDREGLGLGLPLAREIARRHGGDCTLDTSPLGGTVARFTVRRAR